MTAAGFHGGAAHIMGKRFAVVIPEFENIVEIGGFEAVKNVVGDSDDAHDTFPFIFIKIWARSVRGIFILTKKQEK